MAKATMSFLVDGKEMTFAEVRAAVPLVPSTTLRQRLYSHQGGISLETLSRMDHINAKKRVWKDGTLLTVCEAAKLAGVSVRTIRGRTNMLAGDDGTVQYEDIFENRRKGSTLPVSPYVESTKEKCQFPREEQWEVWSMCKDDKEKIRILRDCLLVCTKEAKRIDREFTKILKGTE